VNENVSTIVGRVRDLLSKGPVSLGQIAFIGLKDVRTRIGEESWTRHRDKIRDIATIALRDHCSRADAHLRCSDEEYLIVFSNCSEEAAAARATAIASEINQQLLGIDETGDVRVYTTVSAVGPMTEPQSATVEQMIEMFRQKAAERARAGTSGVSDIANLALERTGRRAKLKRSLARPNDPPVQYLFNPYLHAPTGRVATFRCVAIRQMPHGAGRKTDYDILGSAPAPEEIIQFDIDILEEALLALTFAIRRGRRVHLVLQLHFETAGSRAGREQIRQVLEFVPMPLRDLISFNLAQVPPGIPAARLQEMIGFLRSFGAHLSVDLEPDLTFDDYARLAELFAQAGLHFISYRLPRSPAEADIRKACHAIREAKRHQLSGAIRNVSDADHLPALTEAGYEYLAGAGVGDTFEFLPAPYRQKSGPEIIRLPLEL
jgi:hypothetical protein